MERGEWCIVPRRGLSDDLEFHYRILGYIRANTPSSTLVCLARGFERFDTPPVFSVSTTIEWISDTAWYNQSPPCFNFIDAANSPVLWTPAGKDHDLVSTWRTRFEDDAATVGEFRKFSFSFVLDAFQVSFTVIRSNVLRWRVSILSRFTTWTAVCFS